MHGVVRSLLLVALLGSGCRSPEAAPGDSGGGGSTTGDDGASDSGDVDSGGTGGDDTGSGPAPVQVYVLSGQSNSLGTTAEEGADEAVYGPGEHDADAATELFWSNVHAANDMWPAMLYGDSGGMALALQMQQGAGANLSFWGPEFGLARHLDEVESGEVLVIKASRGGGGNTLWSRSAFESDPASGHMWGHLAETTELGLGELQADERAFELRGFLYLQGESNSDAEAAEADLRLRALVDDFTSLVEGIAPGSTASMHTVVGEIAASDSTPARAQTTELQRAFADSDPDVSFVDTADLPLKSDGIHFGRDAKLEIGARFAEALLD